MDIKTIDEYILMEMAEEDPKVSMLAAECQTTEEYVVKKLIRTEEQVYELEDRVAELINKYEVKAEAEKGAKDEEDEEEPYDPKEGITFSQACDYADFVSKKAKVYDGHEDDIKKRPYETGKSKIVLDFSDLNKTVEQMFADAKERVEKGDDVKDFVKELETEYVPALKEMLYKAGVPLHALKKEVAAAKIVYMTFVELARLGDSKINKIIAANLNGFKK